MSAIELSTPFYEKQYNMFNICSQSINAHLAALVRNHNRENTAIYRLICYDYHLEQGDSKTQGLYWYHISHGCTLMNSSDYLKMAMI